MQRSIVRLIQGLVVVIGVTITMANCGGESPSTTGARLDFSAVDGLLQVLRATVEASPDHALVAERLLSLDGGQRDLLIDSLIKVKESNSRLVAQIDALLASPAYQFYYRQFRNVNPDVHRRILLALPYGAAPGPASIAYNLLDVVNHLDALTSWADLLRHQIDIETSRRIAMKRLPPGEYESPMTYFIFDGNGDAFAGDGKICFDLYTLVLGKRPPDSRYADLDAIPLEDLHRTVAHEYHHVFAHRFYAEYPTESGDWQTTWYNRLLRRMLQEGTAMHCNPPEGLNRAIKEDTATVVAWIRSLEREVTAIRNGEVDDKAAGEWSSATYHDGASALLSAYLSRTYQGEELDREVAAHEVDRPSLVYTLGWWMVSRISRDGTDPEAVRDLVAHPTTLAEKYNAIVPPGADSLRFPL